VLRYCALAAGVEAIKDEIGSVPLVIKMAFYKDEKKLEEFCARWEDGGWIAAINTISRRLWIRMGSRRAARGVCAAGCGSSVKWAACDGVKAGEDSRRVGQTLRSWRGERDTGGVR